MAIMLNPYLSFNDCARQALEYYHSFLGGELTLATFGEAGVSNNPAEANKIMHGMITTPEGLVIMGSDSANFVNVHNGDAFAVSLSGDDAPKLRGYWEKLVDAGTIVQPLVEAPWGDTFGICQDRFGVQWMVNIVGARAAN